MRRPGVDRIAFTRTEHWIRLNGVRVGRIDRLGTPENPRWRVRFTEISGMPGNYGSFPHIKEAKEAAIEVIKNRNNKVVDNPE